MLQKLHIRNYAIIDGITIGFPEGLNIITGETGAGKSILMGALGLILGERADSGVLLDKEKKCVVEGVFTTGDNPGIRDLLVAQDLDTGPELLIRREIGANGKSRAFINDTPVNLGQLQQLSSLLVDLHQQFDTLSLGNADFQRQVLDALAAQGSLIDNYQRSWNLWTNVQREWKEMLSRKEQFTAAYDYNQFLYNELEEAAFAENEIEESEAALKLLNDSEAIKAALSRVVFELNEADTPIVQQLRSQINLLQPYTQHHTGLPGLLQRLQSVHLELKDIAGELEGINDHIVYDPQRIELLNDKLALGYRLQKKHQVQSTAELLAIKDQLGEKLAAVYTLDEQLKAKEEEMARLQQSLLEQARKISANRQKQVKPLEDKVNKLLTRVGMPNARLKVVCEAEDGAQPREYGIDTIEFLFDANKSGQFAPVRKVASGGELSRLMLCIKSLVAESIDLPTMIFDEIDTGISGEAARQVGIILRELSRNRQVICITHQPQIAGRASAHFYVYKETEKGSVKTRIRLLEEEERVTAIARMLSGEKPTAAALENARELMQQN